MKILSSVAIFEFDITSARLEVSGIACTRYFFVDADTRKPSFEIVLLRGRSTEISSTDMQSLEMQSQISKDLLLDSTEKFMFLDAIFRLDKTYHLYLLELMDTDQSLGIFSVSSRLSSITTRKTKISQGQLICIEHLIDMLTHEWYF